MFDVNPMPIDPQVRKYLDAMSKVSVPELNKTPIEDLRKIFDTPASGAPKVKISVVEDMILDTDAAKLPARLYDDSNSDSLVLYFHGGGFVFGSIETHDSLCRRIAKYSGSKVISVGYRLGPENKFPVAQIDAFNSYLYVLKRSEELGVDSDKIALMGDSAGGNLAAVASLMARDKGIKLPRLQVLVYPSTGPDMTSKSYLEYSSIYLTKELLNWFSSQYLNSIEDALNPYFSPILADLSGLPEAIVVTDEYDPLLEQGETYSATLRDSGVPVTSIRVNGMIHGFLSNFHLFRAADVSLMMISGAIHTILES